MQPEFSAAVAEQTTGPASVSPQKRSQNSSTQIENARAVSQLDKWGN
jgi:hypothetical protein